VVVGVWSVRRYVVERGVEGRAGGLARAADPPGLVCEWFVFGFVFGFGCVVVGVQPGVLVWWFFGGVLWVVLGLFLFGLLLVFIWSVVLLMVVLGWLARSMASCWVVVIGRFRMGWAWWVVVGLVRLRGGWGAWMGSGSWWGVIGSVFFPVLGLLL